MRFHGNLKIRKNLFMIIQNLFMILLNYQNVKFILKFFITKNIAKELYKNLDQDRYQ